MHISNPMKRKVTSISDCGQPSDLTLSSKQVACTTYTCVTTYTCDTGYNVDPPGTSPTISCGTSTWDTRTFTCEPNGKYENTPSHCMWDFHDG